MDIEYINFKDKRFEFVKSIRKSVFTLGQSIPVNEDIDVYDADLNTVYCLIKDNGKYIASGRLIITSGGYKIGRVAVLEENRKQGVGADLVKALCDKAHSLGANEIKLEAQLHAVGFYEKLGFETVSDEPVFDRGIEHRKMRLVYGEEK